MDKKQLKRILDAAEKDSVNLTPSLLKAMLDLDEDDSPEPHVAAEAVESTPNSVSPAPAVNTPATEETVSHRNCGLTWAAKKEARIHHFKHSDKPSHYCNRKDGHPGNHVCECGRAYLDHSRQPVPVVAPKGQVTNKNGGITVVEVDGEWPCPKGCGKVFDARQSAAGHLTWCKHEGITPEAAGQRDRDKDAAKNQWQKKKPWGCPNCNFTTLNKSAIAQHKKHYCPALGGRRKKGLSKELQEGNKIDTPCPNCDKKLTWFPAAVNHVMACTGWDKEKARAHLRGTQKTPTVSVKPKEEPEEDVQKYVENLILGELTRRMAVPTSVDLLATNCRLQTGTAERAATRLLKQGRVKLVNGGYVIRRK